MKPILLVIIMTLYFGTSFSQTVDSLSIFPNPFVSSTNIHFDIAQSDTITLRVFNAVGQTVRTFYQSTFLPSGSYDINFLADSLVDGIYFIRLDIGSTKFITKKAFKGVSSTSISENNDIAKFCIFPNPTTDQITTSLFGSKTITVSDLNGKIIKSFRTNQQIISLIDIRTGQYFITILSNENGISTTHKIIKGE